ncbi:MAG: hypothetical protein AAGG48_29675 [Planctomycetota bacterium]
MDLALLAFLLSLWSAIVPATTTRLLAADLLKQCQLLYVTLLLALVGVSLVACQPLSSVERVLRREAT